MNTEDTKSQLPMDLPPPLNQSEVQDCIQLLESIVSNRLALGTIPVELRRQLLIVAGKISRPDRWELRKLTKVYRKRKKHKEKMEDRAHTAATLVREARRAPVFIPPSVDLLPGERKRDRPKLNRPRHCYICKVEFSELHFFYDAMCSACGDLNYQKRQQTAALEGKVALITGARLKIGYQASLMMLRAGAKVIVTTRFPRDAAERYAREEDFAKWAGEARDPRARSQTLA